MEERDATVSEVVRREGRHTGCCTRSRERGSEAIGPEATEHRPLRDAIVAWDQCDHDCEQLSRWRYPTRRAGLGNGSLHSPASALLVDVTRGEGLELTDAHPGCIKHEQR